MKHQTIQTDILIIGGGTAGCYAAYLLGMHPTVSVLIAEKANIERSGCLAAGVNAINAYVTKGHTPQDIVEYAKKDAAGIVREDLLRTMAEELNAATQELEKLGLVFLKDENGEYVARGQRNIKINGENMKPLLAHAAQAQKNVTVLNHVNITEYLVKDGRIYGAYGFDVNEPVCYTILAKAVLCATGGAAGLYRPNNPGFSRHKMWYPPFNTGAGYAMGIRAGAEMTTFEMRFVALRCKDTIAPVGTIAQGVHAPQVNAKGENYERTYGLTTNQRVWGTTCENRAGRGPCYLRTEGISAEQEQDLYKAYLNMAPSQTLKWLEAEKGPAEQSVEIEGTEPYIVGGHCASGYWVDTNRQTTIQGLFAAGDVAGGCPQKYVSGALAEGKIAANAMLTYLETLSDLPMTPPQSAAIEQEYEAYLSQKPSHLTTEQLEEAMQKVMDEYAGGLGSGYRYHESRLHLAEEKIQTLQQQTQWLAAADMDDLLRIYELKERLVVCRVVIAHLLARKETRWPGFGEYTDYPDMQESALHYVNSYMENGQVQIRIRELVKGDSVYEHSDSKK